MDDHELHLQSKNQIWLSLYSNVDLKSSLIMIEVKLDNIYQEELKSSESSLNGIQILDWTPKAKVMEFQMLSATCAAKEHR